MNTQAQPTEMSLGQTTTAAAATVTRLPSIAKPQALNTRRTHIRTHQHSLPHRHSNSTQQRRPLQASYRGSLPPTSPTQRHRQAASGEALSKRGGKERTGRGCARNKLEKEQRPHPPSCVPAKKQQQGKALCVPTLQRVCKTTGNTSKNNTHTARKAPPPHQHQHQAASRTALPP